MYDGKDDWLKPSFNFMKANMCTMKLLILVTSHNRSRIRVEKVTQVYIGPNERLV